MKAIEKTSEPEEFSLWKSTHPTAAYIDLGHDRLFPGAQRARWALRNTLLHEQKGLCCYCETRIDNGDFHVEHFRPKDSEMFPQLQLAYDNLHACCRKTALGGVDEYCGHKKANVFDTDLISPLEPDCAVHFQYDMMGGVSGTDQRGNITIAILNLNSKLLVRSRKSLIEEFEDLDDEDYLIEIAHHLDGTANPLGEFYTTIKYLHETSLLH